MPKSNTLPQRKIIRLPSYDYHTPGAYFITICVRHHLCLFGQIKQERMPCNAAGAMVARWWHRLSDKFPTLQTDAFVVMPNHLHGIIILHDPAGADPRVRPNLTPNEVDAPMGASLPTVVQWFKTMTTNAYIKGVQQNRWAPFHGKLWQRSYYEHIVRDQRDLDRIREYIHQNPAQWYFDREHVAQRD